MGESSQKRENRTHVIVREKSDIGNNVLASNAMVRESEDRFNDLYSEGGNKTTRALQPILPPEVFRTWARSSDAIPPCVQAMSVNVEQTGWDIIPQDFDRTTYDDEELLNDNKLQEVIGLFKTPWPGKSFFSIRKELREDTEETGNGYLEVLRNRKREILLFNRMVPEDTRLCPLGPPKTEEVLIRRNGKDVKLRISVRRRLYVQIIGSDTVYFKEFGDPRIINKVTGEEMEKGHPEYNTHQASEIIHFTNVKMPNSPYGVPRWFHASPSVVGSRAAEELNVEFFESGGIPPVLIFLSGGEFKESSREHLEGILSGKSKSKLSAAIVEAYSTSGSFDKDVPPKIDVQKFGADSQKDSMFEGYIDKCERRIRKSYRLPPLFVGKAEDYSYATAFASYTVAEEQVFSPERSEVDEFITSTLLSDESLGGGLYKLKSRPLTVKDVDNRIKALEYVSDKGWISPEDSVNTFNRMLDMNLAFDKEGFEENQAVNRALAELAQSMADDPDGDGEEDDEGLEKTESRIDRIEEVAEVLMDRLKSGKSAPFPAYKQLSKSDQKVATALAAKKILRDSGDHRHLKLVKGCC